MKLTTKHIAIGAALTLFLLADFSTATAQTPDDDNRRKYGERPESNELADASVEDAQLPGNATR